MRPRPTLAAGSMSGLVVLAGLAGCAGGDDGDPGVPEDEPAAATGAGAGSESPPLPTGSEPVAVAPADFTARIDNHYWPMRPGTRWTYREVDEAGEVVRVVVTATPVVRRLADGVTALVVRDSVTAGGELVEDTVDWYAQDGAGNVWYLGEDTAEFEDGRVVSREGAWESGVDGALPGVIMPAQPADGQAYRQEHLAGEAEDAGEVLATGQQAEVPAGHYDGVVLTADTTLEPDVLEYKFYAPGVGPVLTLDVSGGAGREELVRVEQVSQRVARLAGSTPLGRPYR